MFVIPLLIFYLTISQVKFYTVANTIKRRLNQVINDIYVNFYKGKIELFNFYPISNAG